MRSPSCPPPRQSPARAFGAACLLLAILGSGAAATAAQAKNTLLLPWLAPSRGALVQTSDLSLLNPGTTAIDVVMTFRKRGTPDVNPPRATRTIQPGQTFYTSDVMQLFAPAKGAPGAVVITVDAATVPVLTSFNSTFARSRRNKFLDHLMARMAAGVAGGGEMQYLVGLRQDATFRTSLFLFNPADGPASYEVTFLAPNGETLGSLPAVQVDAGLGVQLDTASFPLPAGLKTGAFSVRVTVDRGELLSSAQVVDQATGQPAYLQGETVK